MEERTTRFGGPLVIAALILAIGMIAGGYLMGNGLVRAHHADRAVTVRGLAERNVVADLATWDLSYSEQGSDLADVQATRRGFVLAPRAGDAVAVLVSPVDGAHADVLALLADGEAWSSSALALALATSQRTVQRALDVLAATGRVAAYGQGRARRWTTPSVPGFTTPLLLPVALAGD